MVVWFGGPPVCGMDYVMTLWACGMAPLPPSSLVLRSSGCFSTIKKSYHHTSIPPQSQKSRNWYCPLPLPRSRPRAARTAQGANVATPALAHAANFEKRPGARRGARGGLELGGALARVSRAFRDRFANAHTPAPIGLHAGRPRAMPIFSGA